MGSSLVRLFGPWPVCHAKHHQTPPETTQYGSILPQPTFFQSNIQRDGKWQIADGKWQTQRSCFPAAVRPRLPLHTPSLAFRASPASPDSSNPVWIRGLILAAISPPLSLFFASPCPCPITAPPPQQIFRGIW
ncbi:uncharacterized protein BO95DRAFT_439961 [Aspergillus brunneoviolaceus CBS 621.78]|uniref:Uncharacterized protein n=1 Tax=Aspergillus brunneoviolaceus CBS 621.78 TaxID=1450534 RepID=A0ACD1GHT3_9EURO|nr:hypothetical protein BO95DRAFT_439961 [Aspergillus brunneoviolaceus CBS 621.78]RAH48849.1 hypothetical protein BO95DRAFT_439961 [Aspergillus brunneoviolaceus CBS 621.78]